VCGWEREREREREREQEKGGKVLRCYVITYFTQGVATNHHAIAHGCTLTHFIVAFFFCSSFPSLSPMVSPLLPPDVKVCQELDELVVQYMTLIDQHLSALNRVGDRFQQVF